MPIKGLKQQFERKGIRWMLTLWVQFFRDYRAAACQDQAAALTYMTLFALVPFLMTVTYAVFSMVPEFASIGVKVQKFYSPILYQSQARLFRPILLTFPNKLKTHLDRCVIFSRNGVFNAGQYRAHL